MKKRSILAAAVAAATAVLLLPSAAQAQDTVPVYVVHGINAVDDETVVNVCLGDDEEPLLPDFAFTDFAGPLDLAVGAELPLTVYLAPATCGDDGAIITQTVTVPDGPVALVATGDDADGFQLTPYALDLECADAGQGRLSAFHASADTGAVTVEVAGDAVGELAFGEDLAADLPAADYPVTVLLGDTPVVGPDASVPVQDGVNTLVFVTGNFPGDPSATPVVAIVEGVEVGTCDAPTPPPAPEPVPETPTGPDAVPATPVAPAGAERSLSLTG